MAPHRFPGLVNVEYTNFLNLPTSASTEKGVALLAIIEETGVVGALVFILWALYVLPANWTDDRSEALPVLTIIALNFGEATFFSIGGFGLLPLLMLGYYATQKSLRNL